MDLPMVLEYVIAFFSLFSVNVYILLFLKHRNDYAETAKPEGAMPIVSIIMPAYNEGRFISESIDSLLAIDYPHDLLDIIVVDDGSSDETYKIAKSLEGKGIPLRVLHKDNGGKGSALNFGIRKAKGEFIATMDADSFASPDIILKLLPYFEDPDVMAATPAVKIKAGDSWLREFQRIEYLMILFTRRLLSFIDCVPVTPGPFSLFRASVFEKIGLFDEHNMVEDHEIAMRIQANHFKIKSSVVAEVYTEPPLDLKTLMHQRARWQLGGILNYWRYRAMISPAYGDFGLFVIPFFFITIAMLIVMFGLAVFSFINSPYYVRYIFFDTLTLGRGFFTVLMAMVTILTFLFIYAILNTFKNERVRLRHLISFMLLYWVFAFGYNALAIIRAIQGERYFW